MAKHSDRPNFLTRLMKTTMKKSGNRDKAKRCAVKVFPKDVLKKLGFKF